MASAYLPFRGEDEQSTNGAIRRAWASVGPGTGIPSELCTSGGRQVFICRYHDRHIEEMLVYLWEEWGLLDEVQGYLYHSMNQKNLALTFSILTGQGTHALPSALIRASHAPPRPCFPQSMLWASFSQWDHGHCFHPQFLGRCCGC